ncbi:MAG: acyltransferase family protein [Pseudomonadota bacterium]
MDGGRLWLSVQHLRAFAALAVVLFHVLQWARIPFETGQAGVDVFFVISGFVMWTTTAGRPARPGRFLVRRLIRVAPLYWLVTLALAAAVVAFPARFPDLSAEPRHLLLSMAFVQHYNPAGVPFPLLAPGWTLNYEAVFYLVFAAGLFLPEERRLFAVTFALLVLALAGFFWPPFYILLLNPLFLEFLAGVWIARLAQLRFLPERGVGWFLFGGALMLFTLIQLLNRDWDLWRPLIWGAPAVLLVLGAVSVEADGGWGSLPGLKTLGDASYSIYLVHTLPVGALAVVFGVWNLPAFAPLATALAVAAGLACWRLLERPLVGTLRRLA